MGEDTRIGGRSPEGRPSSLGELIHAAVRRAIEVVVDEELAEIASFEHSRPELC